MKKKNSLIYLKIVYKKRQIATTAKKNKKRKIGEGNSKNMYIYVRYIYNCLDLCDHTTTEVVGSPMAYPGSNK